MIRRLSNISKGNREKVEVVRVTNKYTVQLRQSGYECEEARSIIKSGILGMVRKKEIRRRLENTDRRVW